MSRSHTQKKLKQMENPRNHRQFTNSTSMFASLPIELLHNIFARLPSKPLHICKSVSKQWYSIITGPEFTHFHLLHSRSSPRSNRLLVSISKHHLYSLELDTGNPNNDVIFPFSKHTNIASPIGEKHTSLNLVGSCNGLVCFTQTTTSFCGSKLWPHAAALCQDRLFVYNPFTRGPIREVSVPVVDPGNKFYGFGYDAAADDYKIMLVHKSPEYYQARHGRTLFEQHEAKVFGLRTMSWKQVDDFCYMDINWEGFENGKFVEGSLHWDVVLDDDDDDDDYNIGIGRFDLSSDKYTFMKLPTELSKCMVVEEVGVVEVHVELEVLDGNLCMQVMKYGEKDQCDVWVMKEYGVKESWTRLFSIGCPIGNSLYSSTRYIKVVAYSTFGDRVLVISNDDYYWYDTDGNDLGEALIDERSRDIRRSYCVASIICNPSLVSPFLE